MMLQIQSFRKTGVDYLHSQSQFLSMRTRAIPFYIFAANRLLVVLATKAATSNDAVPPSFPPVQIRIPSFDGGMAATNLTQIYPRQCPNNRAYVLTSTPTTSSSWHVVFAGEATKTKDGNNFIRLVPVSQQSRMHHCVYAMNAGPFHTDGSPVGWMISQGKVISKDDTTATSYAGFGKTWDGFYYIGVPPTDYDDDPSSARLQDFVTGFGWLVYQGRSVFEKDPDNDNNDDDNPTGAVRAPRTAIGIDSHGKLIWLIVDGCQFW
jgi:hypothetical protein